MASIEGGPYLNDGDIPLVRRTPAQACINTLTHSVRSRHSTTRRRDVLVARVVVDVAAVVGVRTVGEDTRVELEETAAHGAPQRKAGAVSAVNDA